VKKDALTAMYAYAPEHVQPMLAAGVDIIGVHAGGTAGGTTGSLGEELLPLQRAIEMVNYCYDLAMKENPNAIVVVHGGPFEDPSAVKACYQATPAHGYIGASGVERIPVEKKLAQVYGEYRALHTAGKDQRP
jgi:predicted TIM-barrel enzyme